MEKKSYDLIHQNEGITRKKIDDNFVYYYIKNNEQVTEHILNRINKLRIPPAWTELWISIDPSSTIQVIGTDVKGRKQYIYHKKHVDEAEKEKFLRLYKFIKALPQLEKNIKNHIHYPAYNKYKVITTMLNIVKLLHIRAGKEKYARENKSYGISSLKKKHIKIIGNTIKFKFKGKSRKILNYTLTGNQIKEHLQKLLKLEGEKLFQYIDENDFIRKVSDTDLNHYIQDFMGQNFTIKDFRTYAANYHFIETLLNETKKRTPKNDKVIKKNIINAIKITAHYLRHTKSISKKSYIMNFAIELYKSNPEYFIKRKHDDPTDVVLEILRLYRNNN
jgi:DNA topoisomerase-1